MATANPIKVGFVLRAVITSSGAGDNAIVAAVTGKKIRVRSYVITASAAVNAKWRSATNDISGLHYFAAAGDGICASLNPDGWVETNVGEALNLNLGGAVPVGGQVTYELVS